MSVMKFYEPTKKYYLYLSSAEAIETQLDANNIMYFKWNIPPMILQNAEIKLKFISGLNANADNKYVIRLLHPQVNNFYDSMAGSPILFISTGLTDTNFTEAPNLRVSNKTLDYLTIKITNSILPADRDNGLSNAISFILLLEISDYEETETIYKHIVDTKQNYNMRIF